VVSIVPQCAASRVGRPADRVYREQAIRFCEDFSLAFEETDVPESPILRQELERCKRLAARAAEGGQRAGAVSGRSVPVRRSP
jgi:hypothetical protein